MNSKETPQVECRTSSRDMLQVIEQWSELERAQVATYFNSTTWQALWHNKLLCKNISPRVLCISEGDSNKLMASYVLKKQRLLAIWEKTTAFLNYSGEAEIDVVCAENCLPLIRSESALISNKFLSFFFDECKADELILNAIPASVSDKFKDLAEKLKLNLKELKRTKNFWVNLRKLKNGGDHLSSLAPRTRGIIRRSVAHYEEDYGELKLAYAQSAKEAKSWFLELIDLNIRRLDSKEQYSSFRNPFLREFHLDLIDVAFAKNEIFMARVIAGTSTIGYVYGFSYKGSVFVYQTGFNFDLNPKLSPGLVAHHLVVKDLYSKGFERYDFLAGDYQYKRSLSNESDELVWLSIRKPNYAFMLEDSLLSLKRKAGFLLRKFKGISEIR